MKDILISNGHLIDPLMGTSTPGDLLISNGTISGKAKPGALKKTKYQVSIDASNCIVCPGFIDLNARMREPGPDSVDSLSSSSLAATAGGFTTVACMPDPLTTNDNPTDYFLRQAIEQSSIELLPIGPITQGSRGEQLADIGSMLYEGIVAIADDGRPLMNAHLMRKVLEYTKLFPVPVFSFPQDLNLTRNGVMDEGVQSYRLGLRGIPSIAEKILVDRDISLAKHTNSSLHFSSISTRGAVESIRQAKKQGMLITAETNPPYFTLTSDAIASYDSRYKCFPPLRAEKHLLAIQEALGDGTLDAISSMHTPRSAASKDLVFEHASYGMISFETTLALSLNLVRKNIISMDRLVSLLCWAPAKILRLEEKEYASLEEKTRANITVFDPNASHPPVHSLAKNTPFLGTKCKGAVKATIFNGKQVYG